MRDKDCRNLSIVKEIITQYTDKILHRYAFINCSYHYNLTCVWQDGQGPEEHPEFQELCFKTHENSCLF